MKSFMIAATVALTQAKDCTVTFDTWKTDATCAGDPDSSTVMTFGTGDCAAIDDVEMWSKVPKCSAADGVTLDFYGAAGCTGAAIATTVYKSDTCEKVDNGYQKLNWPPSTALVVAPNGGTSTAVTWASVLVAMMLVNF